MTLGRPRVHVRRTGSTNERARALAQAGAPDGTLVTAAEQTAGRGRQGREWLAPPGSSLLASLIVREPPTLLSLIAGVAVCDAIGEQALLKWPNDVVLERDGQLRKLGGILVEGRPQERWAVVGVGVNVAVRLHELPAPLQAQAATLGLDVDAVEPLLERFLRALERRLRAPADAVLQAWRARDALRGRPVRWEAGSGVAEGIDEQGRLVVELDGGGRAALNAGEVHLAR